MTFKNLLASISLVACIPAAHAEINVSDWNIDGPYQVVESYGNHEGFVPKMPVYGDWYSIGTGWLNGTCVGGNIRVTPHDESGNPLYGDGFWLESYYTIGRNGACSVLYRRQDEGSSRLTTGVLYKLDWNDGAHGNNQGNHLSEIYINVDPLQPVYAGWEAGDFRSAEEYEGFSAYVTNGDNGGVQFHYYPNGYVCEDPSVVYRIVLTPYFFGEKQTDYARYASFTNFPVYKQTSCNRHNLSNEVELESGTVYIVDLKDEDNNHLDQLALKIE